MIVSWIKKLQAAAAAMLSQVTHCNSCEDGLRAPRRVSHRSAWALFTECARTYGDVMPRFAGGSSILIDRR